MEEIPAWSVMKDGDCIGISEGHTYLDAVDFADAQGFIYDSIEARV